MDEPLRDPPDRNSSVEEWMSYAHLLQKRIAEQRKHIKSIDESKRQAGQGNKWSKARVARLERALGQSEERAFKRREAREGMYQKLLEAREELALIRSLLTEDQLQRLRFLIEGRRDREDVRTRVRDALKVDDRQEIYRRCREIFAEELEDTPERAEALRIAAEYLGLPTQSFVMPIPC